MVLQSVWERGGEGWKELRVLRAVLSLEACSESRPFSGGSETRSLSLTHTHSHTPSLLTSQPPLQGADNVHVAALRKKATEENCEVVVVSAKVGSEGGGTTYGGGACLGMLSHPSILHPKPTPLQTYLHLSHTHMTHTFFLTLSLSLSFPISLPFLSHNFPGGG
jgi:hypothetical protein